MSALDREGQEPDWQDPSYVSGGGIASFQEERHENTLDESVCATIVRDLKQIVFKLSHVVFPRKSGENELRDWDLWGPLILCFILAIILSTKAPSDQSALIFASVFVIVWAGSFIVTLNALLLGGKISFFQSVCVLGYCLFPLNCAAFACLFWENIFFRIGIIVGCFCWAIYASLGFISSMVPAPRKFLAVYPVLLFYLIISWMILVGIRNQLVS